MLVPFMEMQKTKGEAVGEVGFKKSKVLVGHDQCEMIV